jgi:hypothetical protein
LVGQICDRTHSPQVAQDGCGDANGGKKRVGAAAVAHHYTPPGPPRSLQRYACCRVWAPI